MGLRNGGRRRAGALPRVCPRRGGAGPRLQGERFGGSVVGLRRSGRARGNALRPRRAEAGAVGRQDGDARPARPLERRLGLCKSGARRAGTLPSHRRSGAPQARRLFCKRARRRIMGIFHGGRPRCGRAGFVSSNRGGSPGEDQDVRPAGPHRRRKGVFDVGHRGATTLRRSRGRGGAQDEEVHAEAAGRDPTSLCDGKRPGAATLRRRRRLCGAQGRRVHRETPRRRILGLYDGGRRGAGVVRCHCGRTRQSRPSSHPGRIHRMETA
mmetsp:Transcript_1668/g.6105  ORF Transcript_1668/g.6105 Transcript_1668/m.6105 type:complete len:268 (-) Transcript_1668:40-843(-)